MIHLEEEPTEQEMKCIQTQENKLRRSHLSTGMALSPDMSADSAPSAEIKPSAGGYTLVKKRPAGSRRKELEADAQARKRAAKAKAKSASQGRAKHASKVKG